jgi:hypothetical protein
MKQIILAASCIIAMLVTASSCSNKNTAAAYTSDSTLLAMEIPTLPVEEEYVDLKTGNTIHIRRDPEQHTYTREDKGPLDVFVSTRTRDTFWGPRAILVNNALQYDNGVYKVDEMRIERNGEGFKAKSADGEVKIKDNENELKMKNGDAKVKQNDNEYKYKDDDIKVKRNDDEIKIKTDKEKIIIDRKTGEAERKRR